MPAILFAGIAVADEYDDLKVGVQPDGRIVVPTNQILKPAGKQVLFPGRPVDLAWCDDGKTIVVKNLRDLVFLDPETGKVKQTLPLPVKKGERDKPGFGIVGLAVRGNRIYATDADSQVRVAVRNGEGVYAWDKPINLAAPKVGGKADGSGLAFLNDQELWVLSTRGNEVQRIALDRGEVIQRIPVGVAPFTLCFAGPDKCYVSNWGGDPPKAGEPQGESSKTPIRIDPSTGVANHGSVSVLKRGADGWKQEKAIAVGLHPSSMLLSLGKGLLYVANANSDTVSVVDTRSDAVVETIACKSEARLPFGSGSNALSLSPDGKQLYVANGTNNCVAVVELGVKASEALDAERPDQSRLLGLIPTGWYPGAILVSPDGKKLFVANIKGHGSLSQPRPAAKGMNSHDHLGSVSIIDVPNAAQLARYILEVNANNRLAYSIAGLDKSRDDAKPHPVPQRHGEPSLFKHVIYIIKENRTYDQVLGDMKEGNGDPKLAMFGEEVTPNHHALARQFTLFDNFYCSGVLSADGHTWCNQAYVTDYMERSFGGWTRSYADDGSDPLAYAPTGFLWQNALKHKKTLRNYGEYIKNTYPKDSTWTDFYTDFSTGAFKLKGAVTAKANIELLQPHTHPGYPWFPLLMPDVYRAHLFIEELKQFEQKGEMTNLIYLTLPCDHTDGTRPGYPTPRAMVADNDLALGRVVEAVTKSKFWKDTCIFVVEDDPQNGFDHVDGHRTVALAISPYTKRKFVDHTCYNQTGMVKTIEMILGLPPMNQLDLSATPMRRCFQAEADLTPYAAVPNKIQLDEMNPALKALKGRALYWAKKSLELDLDDGDEADEDTLNRILWHSVHGDAKPYPEEYVSMKE
jgi:YVTN family beta-propeller protein